MSLLIKFQFCVNSLAGASWPGRLLPSYLSNVITGKSSISGSNYRHQRLLKGKRGSSYLQHIKTRRFCGRTSHGSHALFLFSAARGNIKEFL